MSINIRTHTEVKKDILKLGKWNDIKGSKLEKIKNDINELIKANRKPMEIKELVDYIQEEMNKLSKYKNYALDENKFKELTKEYSEEFVENIIKICGHNNLGRKVFRLKLEYFLCRGSKDIAYTARAEELIDFLNDLDRNPKNNIPTQPSHEQPAIASRTQYNSPSRSETSHRRLYRSHSVPSLNRAPKTDTIHSNSPSSTPPQQGQNRDFNPADIEISEEFFIDRNKHLRAPARQTFPWTLTSTSATPITASSSSKSRSQAKSAQVTPINSSHSSSGRSSPGTASLSASVSLSDASLQSVSLGDRNEKIVIADLIENINYDILENIKDIDAQSEKLISYIREIFKKAPPVVLNEYIFSKGEVHKYLTKISRINFIFNDLFKSKGIAKNTPLLNRFKSFKTLIIKQVLTKELKIESLMSMIADLQINKSIELELRNLIFISIHQLFEELKKFKLIYMSKKLEKEYVMECLTKNGKKDKAVGFCLRSKERFIYYIKRNDGSYYQDNLEKNETQKLSEYEKIYQVKKADYLTLTSKK